MRKEELMKHKKLSKRALALTLASAMVLGLTPVPALPFTTVQVAEAAVTQSDTITGTEEEYDTVDEIKAAAETLISAHDETIMSDDWVNGIEDDTVNSAASTSQIFILNQKVAIDGAGETGKAAAVAAYNKIVNELNKYVANADVSDNAVKAKLAAYVKARTGVGIGESKDTSYYIDAYRNNGEVDVESCTKIVGSVDTLKEEIIEDSYKAFEKGVGVVTASVTVTDYDNAIALAHGYIDNVKTMAQKVVELKKFKTDAITSLEDYAADTKAGATYTEKGISDIDAAVANYTDQINDAKTTKEIGNGEDRALLNDAYDAIDQVDSLEDEVKNAKALSIADLKNSFKTLTEDDGTDEYDDVAALDYDWTNFVPGEGEAYYSTDNAKKIFNILKKAIKAVDEIEDTDVDYAGKIEAIEGEADLAIAEIPDNATEDLATASDLTVAKSLAITNLQAYADKKKKDNEYQPQEIKQIAFIVNSGVTAINRCEKKGQVETAYTNLTGDLDALLTKADFQAAADNLQSRVAAQKVVAKNYFAKIKTETMGDTQYGPDGLATIATITEDCESNIDDVDKDITYSVTMFDEDLAADRTEEALVRVGNATYTAITNNPIGFTKDEHSGEINGYANNGTNIVKAAVDDIDAVPDKDTEISNNNDAKAALTDYKNDAQEALKAYAAAKKANTSADYSDEDIAAIDKALADGIAAVKAATSNDEVDDAVYEAEAKMDDLQTASQAVVAADELATARTEASDLLDLATEYINAHIGEYTTTKANEIKGIITTAKTNVANASTIEDIAAETAKFDADGKCNVVTTSKEDNLAGYKADAIGILDQMLEDAHPELYYEGTAALRDDYRTQINDIITAAKNAVEAVTVDNLDHDPTAINTIVEGAEAALEQICVPANTLETYQKAEDRARANEVINLIKGLKASIDAAKGAAATSDAGNRAALDVINEVEAAYNELTDAQKAIVEDESNTYNLSVINEYKSNYEEAVLSTEINKGIEELEQMKKDFNLDNYNPDKVDVINEVFDAGKKSIQEATTLDAITAAIAKAKEDLAAVPTKTAEAVEEAKQEAEDMKKEAEDAQAAAEAAQEAADAAQKAADEQKANLDKTIADATTKAEADANAKVADVITAQTNKAAQAEAAAQTAAAEAATAKAEAAKAAEAQKAAEAKLAAATGTAAQTAAAQTTVGKASIKKLTNKKGKKLVVAIDPVDGATGYEVSIATKKNFKSNFKMATTTKTSSTFKKLKKKTYYVRVRAYKTTADGSVYGNYSDVKKIKIKK